MILQALGFSPKGFRKPTNWQYWAFAALAEARDYYLHETGKGFAITSPKSFTGSKTWDELKIAYPPTVWNGFNLCIDAMSEIGNRYNICNKRKGYYLFYFHPPLSLVEEFDYNGKHHLVETEGNPQGMGGMVGNENWSCDYTRPGTGILGDVVTWLMCGYEKSYLTNVKGWPSSWPGSRSLAWKSIAHEIGHMCGLTHPDPDDGSIMGMWMWDDRRFTQEQIETIRGVL